MTDDAVRPQPQAEQQQADMLLIALLIKAALGIETGVGE